MWFKGKKKQKQNINENVFSNKKRKKLSKDFVLHLS